MRSSLLAPIVVLPIVFAAPSGLALETALEAVDPGTIPDSQYVQVKDGHLSLDGQRVRYWGVIGKVFADSKGKAENVANARKGTDVLIQRYLDCGFNACRFWGSAPNQDYTAGDGSPADDMDYFVAAMKRRGLKLWCAGMNNAGAATAADVGVIDDPATADAWAKAVTEAGKGKAWNIRNNPARVWDPRLEAIGIRNMKAVATHYNKYTGLRWCDDPVFIVWELSNEEWWMSRMRGGSWQSLPAFFRNQLIARWNDYLKAKYGNDEALKTAWKDLLPGERLDRATVALLPMAGATSSGVSINDSNEAARQALTGLAQTYRREDFAPQRGSDVLEFFMQLLVAHKQREAAAIKPLGKSTRLSPMIYDTGTGYDIHSQYLHSLADAVSHDAYVNGSYRLDRAVQELTAAADPTTDEHRRKVLLLNAERQMPNASQALRHVPMTPQALSQLAAEGYSPWVNWLLKPPGISQGVPWLEHNKIEGKPYLCYETQIQQPAKFRADFPLRIAALASIQDWDFVAWHYFGPVEDAATNPRPFDKRMDITVGSHPQGYHYTFDEVQNAMMRAAGLIWRQQLLAPAPNPTIFVYGRQSLYNVNSMPYAGSYGRTGLDMLQTVYQHGCRIAIDPTREDDQVIGPVVSFDQRNDHNAYTPTPQIHFDWKNGFLSFDSPAAVAWTGLMADRPKITFANGVELSQVAVVNPPDCPDPIAPDERYIAFALHALDGRPLGQCDAASLSIVSTSFNHGFKLGDVRAAAIYRTLDDAIKNKQPSVTVTWEGQTTTYSAGKELEQARKEFGDLAKTLGGGMPVLVSRVAAVVTCPGLNGMTYTLRDWHMQPIGSGRVTDDQLVIPADKPIWCIELKR